MKLLAAVSALALAVVPAQALAWGGQGHRIIGQEATRALPPEIPAFLRTPQAILDIGEQARDLDRSRGAGKVHDDDRDAGHFVDLEIDGTVMGAGGPRLDALPATRADYEAALQKIGQNSWKAGYLPYAIVDRYQQLTKDFAHLRVLDAALANPAWKAHRAWFVADRRRREAEIFLTIGDLAHLVGDGSQPLHVSLHYNGWGSEYPNPHGYTNARIHGPFEGKLVKDGVSPEAVRAAMTPLKTDTRPIEAQTAAYLLVTGAQVEPLYQLEKAGGLADGDPRGVAFATVRLAAGASELRDMIVEAWRASPGLSVGWKAIPVGDVISGKIDPYEALRSID